MNPSDAPAQTPWPVLLKRLAIWAAFFALVYLIRDFFFLAFMTFMFSYSALAIVGWGMRRLSPNQERPGLRRLLIIAVFVLSPIALAIAGLIVVPRLIAQGQKLAGWLSRIDPEAEVSRLLERYVGNSEFTERYGGSSDERYRKGLDEFRKTGERYVAEYNQFPQFESWIEGGFARQFDEAERGRIRAKLIGEDISSQAFEHWFLTEKVPQLQAQAKRELPATGQVAAKVDPLVRSAATADPQALLQQVRRDPSTANTIREEWVKDTLDRELKAAQSSPAYHEQFHTYYDEQRAQTPKTVPYTFEEFIELQKARPKGRVAFGDALEKLRPSKSGDADAQLRADFETAKKHDFFESWWATSSSAKFVRQQIASGMSGTAATGRLESVLSSLLNVPLDLGSALLLSFFICIDFPALKRASHQLRDTWLRDAYNEMAPALTSLALLIGRAMQAQSLIALCNAGLLFLAMTFLGVEHAALLAGAVFVLCMVPTIGTMIAWVLIVAVALLQPEGGLGLALKASVAVIIVVLLETFVFSPRILGRMMEVHPVLILAILPLAQYFFGVWGLILATPVMVYVIHDVILQHGLPGIETPSD